MTYKNMMKGVVERKAGNWFKQFIKTEGAFTVTDGVDFQMEDGTCYFKCKVTVYGTGSLVAPKYMVGGTVDETGRVYSSTIRTDMYVDDKMVWASSEAAREVYHITEFSI